MKKSYGLNKHNLKGAILTTFFALLLLLLSCGNTNTDRLPQDNTEQHQYVTVRLFSAEGDFALMANPKLNYCDEKLVGIDMEKPTLLSCRLSEAYQNGAGIIDGKTLRALSERISTHLADDKADPETAALLSEILKQINDVEIITNVST